MKKPYYAWLNNLYAQEQAMARMYLMHAKDASHDLNSFPELKHRLAEHAQACKANLPKINSILERHHLKPNPAKLVLGETMGSLLGFTGDVTIDKVIMNNLTDYGMVHFEIGAYQTVIAAAQQLKDPETIVTCQAILKEKQEFANWLNGKLGETAQEFLKRTTA